LKRIEYTFPVKEEYACNDLDSDHTIVDAVVANREHERAQNARIHVVTTRDSTLVLLKKEGSHEVVAFVQDSDRKVTFWQGEWTVRIDQQSCFFQGWNLRLLEM